MPTVMYPHQFPATTPEPGVDWWAWQNPQWRELVTDRPVDGVRTAALKNLVTGDERTDRVRTSGSTPLQLAGKALTTVTTFPSLGRFRVPLPELVWTNGYTNPDQQWFGVDPTAGTYWEISSLRTGLLGWWAHNVRRINLAQRWQDQRSVTGAGIPMWAMIPPPSQMADAGLVQTAFNFVVGGGYSTEKVPWVSKSDGGLSGHPLRAGERLRLTREAYERYVALASTPADRGLAWGLRHRGAVVNDKTRASDGHALRLHYGCAITLELHLLDFEVVLTP